MIRITTNRLIIRDYVEEDFDAAFALFSDPVTMSFWPRPFDREQTKAWMDKSRLSSETSGFGRWVVALKDTNRIIGDCGLMRSIIDDTMEYDLGYIISRDYWHQGYGLEAADACLNYGFEVLGLPRICANMPHDHDASRKVAEKLGMKQEKIFVNAKNRNIPTFLYARSRQEKDGPAITD